MRRDEPNRHGRAADALIATYLRELATDDVPDAPLAVEPQQPTAPSASLTMPAAERAPEATL